MTLLKVTINEASGPGSLKVPGKNEIQFDTKNGQLVKDENGNWIKRSHALLLLHGLGHVYRVVAFGDKTEELLQQTQDFQQRLFIRDEAEQNIINNYETPGAIKLKEGVRKSYSSPVQFYPAVSPTSTQEKKEESEKPRQ